MEFFFSSHCRPSFSGGLNTLTSALNYGVCRCTGLYFSFSFFILPSQIHDNDCDMSIQEELSKFILGVLEVSLGGIPLTQGAITSGTNKCTP